MSNLLPFGGGSSVTRMTQRQLVQLDADAQIAHARLLVAGSLTSQAVDEATNLTAQALESLKQVPEAAPLVLPILRTFGAVARNEITKALW